MEQMLLVNRIKVTKGQFTRLVEREDKICDTHEGGILRKLIDKYDDPNEIVEITEKKYRSDDIGKIVTAVRFSTSLQMANDFEEQCIMEYVATKGIYRAMTCAIPLGLTRKFFEDKDDSYEIEISLVGEYDIEAILALPLEE